MNYSEQKYGDILNMPHHVSATRPQMPMSDRAAQFSPFAALTGYDAAIKPSCMVISRSKSSSFFTMPVASR